MAQYIWFHPLYLIQTENKMVTGQKNNALRYRYVILEQNQLHLVSKKDHLTIVGHSSAPNSLNDNKEMDDSGYYIQGETASQCLARLQKAGLKVAPRVLSLECCHAAIDNGIAYEFSRHPFFENTLIETTTTSIGRNPGNLLWGGMTVDWFGRVVTNEEEPWIFLHAGKEIAQGFHAEYTLNDILSLAPEAPKQRPFFDSIFSLFQPNKQNNSTIPNSLPRMKF